MRELPRRLRRAPHVLPARARPAARVTALAAAALLSGCGGAGRAPRSDPPPAALPTSAVPYLDAGAQQPLTAAWIAREAQLPNLAGLMHDWGYDAGARRYFQGQSRRLQVVDSRTLRFRSASGATAFVGFVRAHGGKFFGGARPAQPFASTGRRGIVVEGAPCACHLATPSYLAVVSRGPLVSWLEINGPRASRRALAALAARAP